MTAKPLILVLTMSKVASVAWHKAIAAAQPEAEVHHIHFLNRRTTRFVEDTIDRSGRSQNVANRSVLRAFSRLPPPTLTDQIRGGRWLGRPVTIVSGIRDPVDRAASILFFYADFYRHAELPLSHREGATAHSLLPYFVENWRAALAGEFGSDTFEARIRSTFVRIDEWFRDEVRECFGIDVLQERFDLAKRSLVARREGVTLFCYRFEDLVPATWPVVREAASACLGVELQDLPMTNVTEARRSRGLYSEFRSILKLPRDMIEPIYADRAVNHFYTQREIEGFKDRWSEPERSHG